MRLGFFIGFLIGAGIASLISMSKQEELAGDEGLPLGDSAGANPLDALKRQAREAREAGRQAAAEKEAEMLRDWDATRHRTP